MQLLLVSGGGLIIPKLIPVAFAVAYRARYPSFRMTPTSLPRRVQWQSKEYCMSEAREYTKNSMMHVFQIIEEFRKIYPDMQMQTASVFLTVALNNGITMREMQDRTGLVQSSCSRNVALLSNQLTYKKKGFGLLVAKEDPVERRRKKVYLTPKGKRVAATLNSIIQRG